MEENSAIKMIARRVTELAVKATTIVASARSGRGILGGRKGRGREGGRKGAGDGGEGQQVEEEATVVVAVDAVEFVFCQALAIILGPYQQQQKSNRANTTTNHYVVQ